MVYEGVGWRSSEVDRSRESIWGFFGRPEGFVSSDFAQIVDVLMLYRSIWVSEADSGKTNEFLAEEGSNFDDFFIGKNRLRYRCFHLTKTRGSPKTIWTSRNERNSDPAGRPTLAEVG